jgi:ubiquinone/menaquinone biosynthesis C-methylase UbiE
MTEPPPAPVIIPAEVSRHVGEVMGGYFSKINGAAPEMLAGDMLDPSRTIRAHEILCRYVDPKGKRILEIGSGYGITLIAWTKQFGLDVTGVEPEGEGFAETIRISRQLCELNGVAPERVVVSDGEKLPFPDATFDIVYSSNVIEHCTSPVSFLCEAIRVLKPGGILHFEFPNFTSYFEGHYYVPIPPLLFKGMLAWWVKTVFGRDPAVARSLRTEINPVWLRKTIAKISRDQPVRIISLGEEVFRERLQSPFQFQHQTVAKVIGPVIGALQRLNFGGIAANLFILLQAHYPIYLTLRKNPEPARG